MVKKQSIPHTYTHTYYYKTICQYSSEMNSNDLNTQNNYCYGCVSRISLHQAHIELNNGIIDVTKPFTNELSDSIILVLKYRYLYNKYIKNKLFNRCSVEYISIV